MERLLLREYNGLNSKTSVSEENGVLILTGIMQRADAKNGNGRIYSRKILEREIGKYKELIKQNRALGECDHGSDPELRLRNCSHLVKDIWWEGNDVWGKIEILENAIGRDLRAMIEKNKVIVGISTRGLGSISGKAGNTHVNDDYSLICFDAVVDPSTAGAFMLKEQTNIWVRVDDIALTEGRIVEAKNIQNNSPSKLHSLLDDILNIGE